MANEIILRDQNFVTVLAGVTDNAALEIRMLRVNPTTGRLLVSGVGGGGGTVDSVNGQTGVVILDTDDISDSGATNKYFTTTLARAAFTLTTLGSSGAATYTQATGVFNIPQYSGGGGGSPAGSNTEIQFNDSGSFGADSRFAFDSVLGQFDIGVVTNFNIPGSDGVTIHTIGDDVGLYSLNADELIATFDGTDTYKYGNGKLVMVDGTSATFIDAVFDVGTISLNRTIAANTATLIAALGDIDGITNGTHFTVQPTTQSYKMSNTTGTVFIADNSIFGVSLGDVDGIVNSTTFILDDSAKTISLNNFGGSTTSNANNFFFNTGVSDGVYITDLGTSASGLHSSSGDQRIATYDSGSGQYEYANSQIEYDEGFNQVNITPPTLFLDNILVEGGYRDSTHSFGTTGQLLSSTVTGTLWIDAGSGSGDVVGPNSAIDKAIARYDSTTGKIIQNSGIIIDDADVDDNYIVHPANLNIQAFGIIIKGGDGGTNNSGGVAWLMGANGNGVGNGGTARVVGGNGGSGNALPGDVSIEGGYGGEDGGKGGDILLLAGSAHNNDDAGGDIIAIPGVPDSTGKFGQFLIGVNTDPGIIGSVVVIAGDNQTGSINMFSAGVGISGDSSYSLFSAQGTITSPTASQLNDRIGGLYIGGYDGSGYAVSGAISAFATEDFTTGSRGTKLSFFVTANGSATRIAGMQIDQDRTTILNGNLKIANSGKGLYIVEGSNATMGVANLSGGTVTISTTKVTSSSRIFVTVNGGTLTNVGSTYISARSAGTSFTISSTNILDASSVAWVIVEPA